MQDYEYIKSVLGGIYSASVGYDEEEAKEQLRDDLSNSTEFKEGFEKELKLAFNDSDVSWSAWFQEYDVFDFDSEEEAKHYAIKILWKVAFDNGAAPM